MGYSCVTPKTVVTLIFKFALKNAVVSTLSLKVTASINTLPPRYGVPSLFTIVYGVEASGQSVEYYPKAVKYVDTPAKDESAFPAF